MILIFLVSVAAYLGANLLVEDKNFLLATSSILSNSARHQSVLNVVNGETNTPQPFDFALRPEQVLSVIHPLISGCDIEITRKCFRLCTHLPYIRIAVKPLKLTSELKSGGPIKFNTAGLPNDTPVRDLNR